MMVFWGVGLFSSLHGAEDMLKSLKPFLEKHCNECHDEDVSKGDLNIDELSFNLKDSNNFGQKLVHV